MSRYDTIPAPDVDVDVTSGEGKAASWPGRQATKLRPSSREVKMLRPSCSECADRVGGRKFLPPDWVEGCTHDPYVTITEVPRTFPVYEDIMETVTETKTERKPVLDENGEQRKHTNGRPMFEDVVEEITVERATGSKRVTGTETVIDFVPKPNWAQVTHAGGVNKGRGVDRALRRGWIFPQMLRSPLWPSGIKRRCQFRECFGENLRRYANGWFCRPEEAALVRISDTSESFQVDFDERSRQFQEDQIASAISKVSVR